MEEARKMEHLKEVTERQLLAEQQILKLEAELREEQKKKEELVRYRRTFNNILEHFLASEEPKTGPACSFPLYITPDFHWFTACLLSGHPLTAC